MFVITIDKFRKAMFTLRSSSHRLMVETGRYYNLSREQRTRPYCEAFLEEEFHFVGVCPLYKELRVKYLPSYFVNNVRLETIYELMSTENEICIVNLAMYIYYGLEERDMFISEML